MMKLRLIPVKGWKYRVIVCDEKGRYAVDDVAHKEMIPPLAERLVRELTSER